VGVEAPGFAEEEASVNRAGMSRSAGEMGTMAIEGWTARRRQNHTRGPENVLLVHGDVSPADERRSQVPPGVGFFCTPAPVIKNSADPM